MNFNKNIIFLQCYITLHLLFQNIQILIINFTLLFRIFYLHYNLYPSKINKPRIKKQIKENFVILSAFAKNRGNQIATWAKIRVRKFAVSLRLSDRYSNQQLSLPMMVKVTRSRSRCKRECGTIQQEDTVSPQDYFVFLHSYACK